MLGLIVSTIAYFFGLWLGAYLLAKNDIELPRFTRWIVLNVFALVLALGVAYVAGLLILVVAGVVLKWFI